MEREHEYEDPRDQRGEGEPQPPAGEGYGGGTPGMAGVTGNMVGSTTRTDEIQQTAPVGTPTAPGTGQQPDVVMNPWGHRRGPRT